MSRPSAGPDFLVEPVLQQLARETVTANGLHRDWVAVGRDTVKHGSHAAFPKAPPQHDATKHARIAVLQEVHAHLPSRLRRRVPNSVIGNLDNAG